MSFTIHLPLMRTVVAGLQTTLANTTFEAQLMVELAVGCDSFATFLIFGEIRRKEGQQRERGDQRARLSS